MTPTARIKPPQRFLITSDFAHVSKYSLLAIEHTLEAEGLCGVPNPQSRHAANLAKLMSRLGLVRNFRRSSKGPVFCACMGFPEYKTVPISYWNELIPYCFDCWPSAWARWEGFFRRHRIRLAFFTARQAAEHFRAAVPQMKCVWLPEATDPAQYEAAKPLAARRIDVLELGRRDDAFHAKITEGLAASGRTHLFEKAIGQVVFPSREDFRKGFGDTKVSVCFPSSHTHPERSGHVETATLRYFESIASKCILFGACPKELEEIFGYNPVIERTSDNPLDQLLAILSNVEKFQPLVDRNYDRLLEIGTWPTRIKTLLAECDSAFT